VWMDINGNKGGGIEKRKAKGEIERMLDCW
jgi:hypothetical protein